MCIDVDEVTARQISKVPTPTPPELGGTMDECIEQLKTREFRKDLLVDAARRLGQGLAERMEDAEGWHDASRIEPAKAALRGTS